MKWRLTKCQLRILVLVGLGFTNEEIGAAIGITSRTVQTHLTNIYSRLGVKSRVEALVTLGWVTIPAQYLEEK